MKVTLWACIVLSAPALASRIVVPPKAQHVMGSVSQHGLNAKDSAVFQCNLPPAISPDADGLPSADQRFSGWKALGHQIKRLSAIVSMPTISYDDMGGVDEDPRWLVFLDLHKLLQKLFPVVYVVGDGAIDCGFWRFLLPSFKDLAVTDILRHSRMSLTKVNRLGLVYFINGTDPALKPIMLTAHQDVVPVADASTWTHPPFSGHFDGQWLWGRGASDDKNSLTGLMSAMEALLSNDTWTPRRGVVLAFGFDEEISGKRGAGSIAKYLESTFGRDSMVLIVDEGSPGLEMVGSDILYAVPAVTEKGHVNVIYELHVQGGHSSIPFPHTGIGIIAEIISILEANPYSPKMVAGSPSHQHCVCKARYSPHDNPELTQLVKAGDLERLAKLLVGKDLFTNFLLQTSQSVDLISGGVKINAMPELITLGVNYRVALHNSIDEIKKRTVSLIQPVVEKYNLSVKAFDNAPAWTGQNGEAASEIASIHNVDPIRPLYTVDYNGTLVLSTLQETPVSPISPTSGTVWDVFSGTIQHTFEFEGGTVVPVGDLMTGNTDTRHYLGLSPNIYRFMPARVGSSENIHTIDERIDMSAHMDALRFYYDLIRNFDASNA